MVNRSSHNWVFFARLTVPCGHKNIPVIHMSYTKAVSAAPKRYFGIGQSGIMLFHKPMVFALQLSLDQAAP
jgi:hypothetical protein